MLDFSDQELKDAAAELFTQAVLDDELLDLFSRELIGPRDLIDRLSALKMFADGNALDLLTRMARESREENEADLFAEVGA